MQRRGLAPPLRQCLGYATRLALLYQACITHLGDLFQSEGRDFVWDAAGLCGLGQQAADHGAELLLRSHHLLVSMQGRREFGVVVPAGPVGDEGVRLQHGFEPLASIATLLSNFG